MTPIPPPVSLPKSSHEMRVFFVATRRKRLSASEKICVLKILRLGQIIIERVQIFSLTVASSVCIIFLNMFRNN